MNSLLASASNFVSLAFIGYGTTKILAAPAVNKKLAATLSPIPCYPTRSSVGAKKETSLSRFFLSPSFG